MTLAELSQRMSNVEFELWLAYSMLQQDQCPHCGLEARDMEDYEILKIKCPNCKQDYNRIRTYDKETSWRSSGQATPSGDSPAQTPSRV